LKLQAVDLLKAIKSKELFLLDGAIGTELDKRGLMGRGRNNIDNPDVVLEIQRQYAKSGCDAITTNTLTMNRIFIETHNIDVSVRDVNKAGVEIAREAAGDDKFVLGNMSSTGQLLEPYGTFKEQQFYDAFKEQAEILSEFGADGILIETVFDLREALCVLRACKDIGSPAVFV
jgi:5-methyltetrahydrofolate--homocysteine methyltransferase